MRSGKRIALIVLVMLTAVGASIALRSALVSEPPPARAPSSLPADLPLGAAIEEELDAGADDPWPAFYAKFAERRAAKEQRDLEAIGRINTELELRAEERALVVSALKQFHTCTTDMMLRMVEDDRSDPDKADLLHDCYVAFESHLYDTLGGARAHEVRMRFYDADDTTESKPSPAYPPP